MNKSLPSCLLDFTFALTTGRSSLFTNEVSGCLSSGNLNSCLYCKFCKHVDTSVYTYLGSHSLVGNKMYQLFYSAFDSFTRVFCKGHTQYYQFCIIKYHFLIIITACSRHEFVEETHIFSRFDGLSLRSTTVQLLNTVNLGSHHKRRDWMEFDQLGQVILDVTPGNICSLVSFSKSLVVGWWMDLQ